MYRASNGGQECSVYMLQTAARCRLVVRPRVDRNLRRLRRGRRPTRQTGFRDNLPACRWSLDDRAPRLREDKCQWVFRKLNLYDDQFVNSHSFIVVGRSAFRVPRPIDAQSVHKLVSGQDHCPAPQSRIWILDRANADADQTTTGCFLGAINLYSHTFTRPAHLIKPGETIASGSAKLGTLRNQTGFHKAPKNNQKFSRQSDNADFR